MDKSTHAAHAEAPDQTVDAATAGPPKSPAPSTSTSGESARAVASAVSNEDGERRHLAEIRAAIAIEEAELDRLRAGSRAEPAANTDESNVEALRAEAEQLRSEVLELNDALLLQQVGIYEYHHPLETAAAYRERLADLKERIRERVRAKEAVTASDRFSYNNSLAQGRKMTADFSKLMLRAYNAEADNCVRSLRAGTVETATRCLATSFETIARLGSMMKMRISDEYHALRVEEIELTGDYLMKVQEEREDAREERERLREERKAEQELTAERERLNKERDHYLNALEALRAQGKEDEAANLQARLSEIDQAIEVNDYRTANTRAGYVYVISNIGAFGRRVVKIGLTRRLEPLDRIRELGDASVPFPFDVHALYFSDDAVTLENELHTAFADRRLNQVNLRREFFFATPTEVRDVLAQKVGNLLDYADAPEATQYYQSHAQWPTEVVVD